MYQHEALGFGAILLVSVILVGAVMFMEGKNVSFEERCESLIRTLQTNLSIDECVDYVKNHKSITDKHIIRHHELKGEKYEKFHEVDKKKSYYVDIYREACRNLINVSDDQFNKVKNPVDKCVEYIKDNPDATRKQTLDYFELPDGAYWEKQWQETHEKKIMDALKRDKYMSEKVIP